MTGNSSMKFGEKDLIIIGAGGHAKVVLEIALENGWNVLGFVDKKITQNSLCGYPVLGTDEVLPSLLIKGIRHAAIGIGHVGNYQVRDNIFANLKKLGFDLPILIHPKACISKLAIIGEGSICATGCIVNTCARVGGNCIINSGAIIEHDVILGDNVHAAPASVILGDVQVGRNTFLGAGSVVLQGCTVGESVIVGAGSTVLKSVDDDLVIAGSPAHEIRKRVQ